MIMSNNDQENIEELLGRFFESEKADKAAEDIRAGEKILQSNPAPELADSVKSEIKTEIARRLTIQKAGNMRRVLYKAVAIAAGFIVVAFVGVRFLSQNGSSGAPAVAMMSAAMWESSDLMVDDPELSTLSAEISEIEDDIMAIRLGESGNGNGMTTVEVETELIEIQSDFWKG